MFHQQRHFLPIGAARALLVVVVVMLFVQLTTCSQYALDTNEVCLENSQGTCECTSEPPKLPCLRFCAATIECPNETMDVRRNLTVCRTKSPLSFNVSTRPFGCTETFNYSSSNSPSTCKRCLQMVPCSPSPESIMTSSANQTITCRAEDNCGRIESCTFHINIDGEAPKLDCTNVNFEANIGQSSISIIGFRDNCVLTENCDDVSDLNITCEGEENNGELRRDLDFTGPNTFRVNTTTRVNCTATDLSGNSARDTFLVIVTVATEPGVECDNITAHTDDADQCSAIVNFTCTITKFSDEADPNITCTNGNNVSLHYPGPNTFCVGTTQVRCTAIFGNDTTQLVIPPFTVDVIEDDRPALGLSCEDVRVNSNQDASDQYSATVNSTCTTTKPSDESKPNITCMDENGGSLNYPGPNTFSVGKTRVTCTATLACSACPQKSNSSRFDVEVLVINTTTLHLDCENVQVNYTQEGDADQCFAAVNFNCALSTNNESNPNITCINDENNDKLDYTGQNMFILGATNVTCTATVGSELASSKFTVDVQVNGESIGNDMPCTTSDTTKRLQDLAVTFTRTSCMLLEATRLRNVECIDASGLAAVSDILGKIVDEYPASKGVTNTVVRIVENVLSLPYEVFNQSVDINNAPTRIHSSLEGQVTKFQRALVNTSIDDEIAINGRDVAVLAGRIPQGDLSNGVTLRSSMNNATGEVALELSLTSSHISTTSEDVLTLPPSIADFQVNGRVSLSFYAFQSNKLFQSREQRSQAESYVVSSVIAATIEDATVEDLRVQTTFVNLTVPANGQTNYEELCSFWSETADGGRWSQDGCQMVDNNVQGVRCSCDHLTSFVILRKNIDVYVTDVTIFVGSIVAIIFILATMITAQSVHSTQARRILVQTCLALLGLHLAFLIGIQRRFSEAACIVFGVLIHFFALSSKSWITVESISIYIQATGKPSQDISHFVMKAAAGAWGFPAIICVVTAVVDRTLHLDDNTYCFFALSTGLYYSVVLFLIALLVLDIIMWAMTAWCLCDKPERGMDPDSKDGANSPVPGKADEGGAARRLKNVMAITPLLCASFFLGFRSFSSPSTIVNILFLVFTDVFGLLLFVLHCVSQAEVRDHWSRCMRCNYAKLHVRIRRRTQRKPYDTSRGLDRPSDRMTMIEMADEADGKADLHGEASNGGLDATDGPDAMEADETSNGKLPTKTTAPDETNPDTSAVDQPGDSKDSSLVSQDKTEKTTEVEGNPDSGKPLLV